MVQSAGGCKLNFRMWLILFVFPVFLGSQDTGSIYRDQKLVHRDLRYNNIEIRLVDDSIETGLIADINKDSLIIVSEGDRKVIPSIKIVKVIFSGPTDLSGSVWAGLFTGMYLGNVLFYQQEDVYSGYSTTEEPFAMATRDYPEGIGAIGINALFGFAGLSLMYAFTPAESKTSFVFSNDENDKQTEWDNFYKYMIGEEGVQNKNVHLVINMGSLSHRVLDSFTGAGTQLKDTQRYTSYLNLVRKIQLSIDVYEKLRIGASVIFQGEPTLMGNFQDVLYTDNYVAIRYDAQGYYGIISYTIVSRDIFDKFELIVGGGIGKLNPNLEFDFSRYHYGGSTEYIIQYNSSDLTSILFTELHYYITNNFSLLFTMDYCNSQEITVRGDDNFRIPERKISFGNGSFGFGVGFHF